MRDPQRIQRIIKLLEVVWEKHPDWRLCQLISNLKGCGIQDLFFLEDDELESLLTLI